MHITAELKRQMRHFGEVWDTDPLIQQQRGEHRRRVDAV